jgi:DNA processing protein
VTLSDAAGTTARLTDAQRLDWLRLIRSENVGPRTFRSLINHFGGASAALEEVPGLAQQRTGRRITLATRESCEREFELLTRAGACLIGLGEPDYPPALRAIDAPPPLLTVRGRLELLRAPGVAIVGSRNASASGLAFTETLARDL